MPRHWRRTWGGVLSEADYGIWAARGIILITVLVAGSIVRFLLYRFRAHSLFSGLDRMLGFLLGLVRGL